LFRQLDIRAAIAERLGRPSANIYRLFPAKPALTDAVCAGRLAASTEASRAAATRSGRAGERAQTMILALGRRSARSLRAADDRRPNASHWLHAAAQAEVAVSAAPAVGSLIRNQAT
jgi:AcrR family transcriptional regulator